MVFNIKLVLSSYLFFGISTLQVNSYTFVLKNYEDQIRKLIFVIMSILQMY